MAAYPSFDLKSVSDHGGSRKFVAAASIAEPSAILSALRLVCGPLL
jgi:hypothetical protein